MTKPLLCDSHAHLDFEQFDSDRDDVIARAFDAGVARIVNVGVDIKSSKRSIRLAESDVRIWAAVGVHPHEVSKAPNRWLETLAKLASHPKVVAVGEIGLDFYRDISPREAQERAFAEQIRLAKSLDLPIIVHIRNAHARAKEILEREGYRRGVLHAFSGDEAFLKWALEKGFYVGFGGPITFKNYRKHHIVAQTPLSRLLVETDCPYLSPHPYRGRRNEPARVVLVAQKVAEVHGCGIEAVARATTENASKLFGFASPYLHRGRKAMGQNFLVNAGVAEKIAESTGEGELVVEIGPGRGILTKMLAERFNRVVAVELDEELAAQVQNLKPNLLVVNKDILLFDLAGAERYYGHKPVVAGNIPYSITSPILFWLVRQRQSLRRAILMVQREVAERLVAPPKTKEYGIPTVILRRYFEVKKLFPVSAGSFSPAPKVSSAVVSLVPREEPICPEVDDKLFASVVRSAFAHRRKLLVTNLRDAFPTVDWNEALRKLKLPQNARGEALSVECFCKLASFIEKS